MRITKKDRKLIKKLAEQLPFQQIGNHEIVAISGYDLLLADHTEVEGEPIEKDKTYYLKNPVYRQIRHDKRMLTHFKNFGLTGLINYVKKFVEPTKQKEAENRLLQIWNQ